MTPLTPHTLLTPIYTLQNTCPAYQLNWSLSLFWRTQQTDSCLWLPALKSAVEPDGVRVLQHQLTTPDMSQLLISTKPSVSPTAMARSVKGRLQYLIRKDQPKAFQRNFSVRSIGTPTTETIDDYVSGQLKHHQLADLSVQVRFQEFQISHPEIDLAKPATLSHALYWYNLHLVLVRAGRWREINQTTLRTVHSGVVRIAEKHEHKVSQMAHLPDHLHLTLRPRPEQSPAEVAMAYMNNTAYLLGQKPIWTFGFYAGTFGEYSRTAVK